MAGYISYRHEIKLDGRQTVAATSPSTDARDDSTLVQQVLSSQMEKAEQWQYHELFETKFVVKDRACRTIIDSESCNNFVSLDLVEKLELLTQPHPHPYYIKWFNSCGKLMVNRIVRINFSIGNYHDTANFDLVPMQACSLLFGQPWVYANNGSHNFVANTYTFRHNGRKMKLVPMSFTEIFEDNLERMKIGIDEIFRDTRKDDIVMSSTKSELQNERIVVPIVLDTNILLASENNQGKEKEKKDEEEKDLSIAPCMLEECSIDQALIISEDEKKGNDNGATATQGMHIYNVPTMSTTYATLEQPIVEPIVEIPLSQNNLLDFTCDKEELCDASLISMPQLVNEHVSSIVEPLCVEFKHVIYIASENEELKLLSSLNT